MKKYFAILFVFSLLLACNSNKKTDEPVQDSEHTQDMAYTSIGMKIDAEKSLSTSEMLEKYDALSIGDTIMTKMTATVNEVCQSKGCWMKLDLENGEEVMVKFKDYGFFMPKDIAGKEVIINGKAFVNEMPVDEQRHYAEDAGESKEVIDAITEPRKTYSFEADGVLLKQ